MLISDISYFFFLHCELYFLHVFCYVVHYQLGLLQMPRQGFQRCNCANFILGFPCFFHFLVPTVAVATSYCLPSIRETWL